MATIHIAVPEAFALDAQGNQLDRLVVKNARNMADMEPQLSDFINKWEPLPKACYGCGDDHTDFTGLCPACLEDLMELANA